MTWKRCRGCAHMFTSGYFTDKAAREIFSEANTHQIVGHHLEDYRPISGRMIDKVTRFVHHGRWLDIGFGNASLILTANEYGFVPVGLDLRVENVDRLLGLGIEAHTLDLTDFARDPLQFERYAVLSMADVLEHAPFPKDYLAAAHALLSKDGVLFLSMPNSDSVLWTALSMQDANPYWSEIEHFHNFGRRRLYALLEECGFTAVNFGLSERYRASMEVIAQKSDARGLRRLENG